MSKKRLRTWDDSFDELVAFHERFGHCCVPLNDPERPTLGKWVYTQRKSRKGTGGPNNKITADQIRRLDSLGFCWNGNKERGEQQWSERFEALKKHMERGLKLNKPLRKWVVRNRLCYKDNSLGPDRIARLEEIGFQWSGALDDLLSKGRKKVRKVTKTEPVRTRRGVRRKPMPKRVSTVPERDCVPPYDPILCRDTSWDDTFTELLLYRKLHGTHEGAMNERLARWLETQRFLYQEQVLLANREQQLEALGLDWTLTAPTSVDDSSEYETE